jgi:peptidoglycan/LPS O-acetylase OafA/YrhL
LQNYLLTKKNYRADVDGLRAVAVISVLLYHYYPKLNPGGFIGVDIFFVISGFLITKNISSEMIYDHFSLKNFYIKRIKRIFPALLLVLFFTFIVGYFYFFPTEFQLQNKHTVGGMLFISNIINLSESGYFDVSSSRKTLLHLWSLGVEEQFYIFAPILFLLIFSQFKSLKILLYFTIILVIFSFSYCIYLSNDKSTLAFYSPLSRVWEIGLGSVLALVSLIFEKKKILTNQKILPIFSYLGLMLLIFSFLFINSSKVFPGLWSVMPTFGTVMIILAGPRSYFNQFLSKKYFVYIGLISYPLYLWHWPILSIYKIFYSNLVTHTGLILCVILTFALATLTYRFVEVPILKSNINKIWKPLLIISSLIILLATLSWINEREGYFPRVFLLKNPIISSGNFSPSKPNKPQNCNTEELKNCTSKLTKSKTFGLIGDSKAVALYEGLVKTSKNSTHWISEAKVGVVPLLSGHNYFKHFQEESEDSLDRLISNEEVDVIVFAFAIRSILPLENYSIKSLNKISDERYELIHTGLLKAIKRIINSNKKIILLVDNPSLLDPTICIPRTSGNTKIDYLMFTKKLPDGCQISQDDHMFYIQKYLKVYEKLYDKYPKNIKIYNPIEHFCNQGVCSMTKNNRRLFSYTDHISKFTSELIGQEINELIGKM